MGVIARIYDFVAGTKIRSADVDAELNQLVSAHNIIDAEIDALQAGTGLADGSVTNIKIATGIDMIKLADGSVTNTEVQYINSLTSNAQTQLDAKIPLTQRAVANGVATLDSGAKIPVGQLPDSIVGQLEYQGTYNATTNVPTLPAAGSSKGFYYVISTGGTVSSIVYGVGDWIVSNGTTWEKVDNTDAIVTVFGRLGAIVAATNDYTWAQIDKSTSSLLDIATRSAADLSSGILPDARMPDLTGDVTTTEGTVATTLKNTGTAGTYKSVTTDAQGRVTAGTNPTTLSGYGITDAAPLSHVGEGDSAHALATPSAAGFISAADLIAFRALAPSGLGTYAVPVGQIFSLFGRYSFEQDATTGELVLYEI